MTVALALTAQHGRGSTAKVNVDARVGRGCSDRLVA